MTTKPSNKVLAQVRNSDPKKHPNHTDLVTWSSLAGRSKGWWAAGI